MAAVATVHVDVKTVGVIIHDPNVFPPRIVDTRPAQVISDTKAPAGKAVIIVTASRSGNQ